MRQQDITLLQSELLRIYKLFKVFCEENNLRFFAIQGTTLGALFWDGIIPWDDDMDLGMPAEDYLRFVNLAKNKLPNSLHFLEFPWYGGKLFSEKTTFIEPEYFRRPDLFHGVYIDVVPLIGLPDAKERRKSFQKSMEKYHFDAWIFDRFPDYKNRAFKGRGLELRRKFFLGRYPFGSTRYITDFSFGYYYKFKTKGFLNPLKHKYCDTTIPISSTYDYDLKSRYGKYRKYPPEEERTPHNSFAFVDCKKSYLSYRADLLSRKNSWIDTIMDKNSCLEKEYYLDAQRVKQKLSINRGKK